MTLNIPVAQAEEKQHTLSFFWKSNDLNTILFVDNISKFLRKVFQEVSSIGISIHKFISDKEPIKC